jgi:gamma-glutamyltranspeptidase/glutathione hydrolase
VLQVVLNVVDFDMSIEEAVAKPRMHHQWLPDRMSIEASGVADATIGALAKMGHTVRTGGRQGTAHSVMISRTGKRLGAPDARDADAGAAGY